MAPAVRRPAASSRPSPSGSPRISHRGKAVAGLSGGCGRQVGVTNAPGQSAVAVWLAGSGEGCGGTVALVGRASIQWRSR